MVTRITRRKKILAAFAGASVLLLPHAAQATTTEPTPPSTVFAVSTGPGDQTDPHVSGDWVVYTDFSSGGGQVRYHNLVTNVDAQIPGMAGTTDSLSEIDGTTVVFVRFGLGAHSIWTFDIAAGGAPVELDPHAASNRRETGVGGRTVAWQDFGFSSLSTPEIVVYDLDTHVATRLTTDSLYDRDPAVSPDGNHVTWTKCTSVAGGCEVWAASRSGGTWTTAALTSSGAAPSLPDTNGSVVVYGRDAGVNDTDIAWQPVTGGTEQQLALPSIQQNPSISGNAMVLESYDPNAASPNFDMYAYDMTHDRLYRLTDTPEDESLSDVSLAADGTATVVFSRREVTGDDNVYAERLVLPGLAPASTTAATVQPPIKSDGSSVFTAKRGVIPVKFALTVDGVPTCNLPPATITVARVTGSTSQTLITSDVEIADCQYRYSLGAKDLGPGSYTIGIVVDGHQVGTATFTLR